MEFLQKGFALQYTNKEKTRKTFDLSDTAKSFQAKQQDLTFSLSVPCKVLEEH